MSTETVFLCVCHFVFYYTPGIYPCTHFILSIAVGEVRRVGIEEDASYLCLWIPRGKGREIAVGLEA